MKIYTEIPPDLPLTALTFGTFDGLHLGHQALLQKMREKRTHTTLLTFTNHPLEILKPEAPIPATLTPLPLKLALLGQYGLDIVITLPFTKEIAAMSFEEWLNQFPLSYLILGEDALFGKDQLGTPERVRAFANGHFAVEYLPKVLFDGLPISSTRIRQEIAQGRLDKAAELLGRSYLEEKHV